MKTKKNIELLKPLLDTKTGEDFELLNGGEDDFKIIEVKKNGKFRDKEIFFDGKYYYLAKRVDNNLELLGKSKNLKKLIPESVANIL